WTPIGSLRLSACVGKQERPSFSSNGVAETRRRRGGYLTGGRTTRCLRRVVLQNVSMKFLGEIDCRRARICHGQKQRELLLVYVGEERQWLGNIRKLGSQPCFEPIFDLSFCRLPILLFGKLRN